MHFANNALSETAFFRQAGAKRAVCKRAPGGTSMRRLSACLALLLIQFCGSAHALDISGTWQADSKPQRVIKIARTAHGYRGDFYHLGLELPIMPRHDSVSIIAVAGNGVHFSLDKAQGTFDGTLSDDGKTLVGSWKMFYFPTQSITFRRATKNDQWVLDSSPHKITFATVQKDVKLEVLDWGGNGPPLIFLAGLDSTGHSFDGFAENFTGKHHVYAISRRGFGASTVAPLTDANYDADRMGDDVLAVIEALHIAKPVLAGHSNGGQELSSVGTRYPNKIAGLIYLESLHPYAFYNPAERDLAIDAAVVRRDLDELQVIGSSSAKLDALIKETQAAVVNLQQSLKDAAAGLHGAEYPLNQQGLSDLAADEIAANPRRYGAAPVPILAIVAIPRRCEPECDSPAMKRVMAADDARADLFEKMASHARVVRIAKASHYIWRSNEAQVEQEMNAFMHGLSH